MSDQVRAALNTIVDGGTLSMDEARGAMGTVMDGEATPAQLAALLMGLRMRGETVDELAGFALAMRERVVRVDAPDDAGDGQVEVRAGLEVEALLGRDALEGVGRERAHRERVTHVQVELIPGRLVDGDLVGRIGRGGPPV